MRKREIVNWEKVVCDIRGKHLMDLRFVFPGHVKMKRQGLFMYKMFCPFHKEKTPSFVYFVESRRWHCFGCGDHGGIIEFYMKKKNVSFRSAVVDLAKIFKIKFKWENIK